MKYIISFWTLLILLIPIQELKAQQKDQNLVVEMDTDRVRAALFDNNPPHTTSAVIILEGIRNKKKTNLKEPLQRLLIEVDKRISNNHEKINDPFRSIFYEIDATVLSLELDELNIQSNSRRIDFLLNRVNEKFISKTGVVNAEIILLKEQASSGTTELLNFFDKTSSVSMQLLLLSILEKSKSSFLEKELLKRANNTQNSPVYGRMLFVLGNIGDSETYNYLSKKMNSTDSSSRGIIKLSLTRLAESTHNKAIRESANKLLESKE